ncbi:MAG: hypothetical protein KC583_01095 [Myxococcales bacterium]|nr:hypothetical protein [Myxococcales bacterium]MCA9557131.1 hypothetical protein [Myxococcales bacterium]MCB9521978.1 hypothetical protein [Myxococcales bacterium]
MGLLDFLSNKPTPSKIARATKRMLNEHHQQQVRQEALEELAAYGTPEAVASLVRRLCVNFKDTIKNEQEKRWVADTLVDRFGPASIEPLAAAIKGEQVPSSAIVVLSRLVSDERLVGVLAEALSQYAPDDHRTIEARLQLVDALGDHLEDDRVLPTIAPYAMDHDDQVRVKVIGLVQTAVKPGHDFHGNAVAQLIDVLEDPEASGRITRTAADALIALKADLTEARERLADNLPDGYRLGEDGKLTAG